MEPVAVKSSFEETYRQLLFVDKLITAAESKKYLRKSIAYLVLTVVVLLIFLLTNNIAIDAWMLLAFIFYLGFALYLAYLKWKTHRRRNYMLKQISNDTLAEKNAAQVGFDEKEIRLTTSNKIKIIEWDDLRGFLEDGYTIYLFPENPYRVWSFSENEIGSAALSLLKDVAKKKLPPLKIAI